MPRQELFLGKSGQDSIQHAHVLIIGAGALGSASSEMLARAGVGTLDYCRSGLRRVE